MEAKTEGTFTSAVKKCVLQGTLLLGGGRFGGTARGKKIGCWVVPGFSNLPKS